MATFYTKKFNREITKALGSPGMRNQARRIAERKVERAEKEMMHHFESHPVTKEIDNGAAASNISRTLGGEGNLFSFIGFLRASQPIEPLRSYMRRSVRLSKNPVYIKTGNRGEYRFKLKTPQIEQIEALTPSPWEGRSWTRGIERGISGLGNYIFSRSGGFDSRSQTGMQSEKSVSALAFRPIKYITSILRVLKEELNK